MWGKREGGRLYIHIYLSLHCQHQNDCINKMGSDENHFNVSLIVRVRVTRQCLQITEKEKLKWNLAKAKSTRL